MAFFTRISKRKPPRTRHFRPDLEILEDRLAPAAPGGPAFSPTDPAAFGAGAIQSPASTAATFSSSTTGVFTSNTAAVFAAGSGSPFASGTGLESAFTVQPVQLPSAVLPAFGPPTLPSIEPPTLPGQIVNAITADVSQTALRVFSPFSLVSFVPPETPPPRAVNRFAPSGGGPAPGNGAANPAPVVPEVIPVLPANPGNPGRLIEPNTINPNLGGGQTGPSDQGPPAAVGSGGVFREHQPPQSAEGTRGPLLPARQALSEEQPADKAVPSDTQPQEKMPPPPVHAPADKGRPAK